MPDSSVPEEGAGAQPPAPFSPPSLLSPLAAALCYAGFGWSVFPAAGAVGERCSCRREDCDRPAKHPLTRHGLHEATTDRDQLARWWRRWPEANVAIATGEVVVIDIDPASGGWESLALLIDESWRLPPTATAVTGGGGAHLYYLAPSHELRNTAGALPGVPGRLPGIDLRAAGGYVIAPPSRHASGRPYWWVKSPPFVAAAPSWLVARQRQSDWPCAPVGFPSNGTRTYGRAALEEELADLRVAPVGTRNHSLNKAAFVLGQLVAGGELDLDVVVNALFDAALDLGLSEAESRRTIESGVDAGARSPRQRQPGTSPRTTSGVS